MTKVAIPGGLEPPTLCLEGRCSIQLSYGTVVSGVKTQKLICPASLMPKAIFSALSASKAPCGWAKSFHHSRLRECLVCACEGL